VTHYTRPENFDWRARALAAEIRNEKDHQAHVKAYWRNQFSIAGAIGDAKMRALRGGAGVPFNPRGCYNPPPFRYPSFAEDPTAYYGGG